MQPPLFDNILSCGSWVKDILDHNNNCKKVIIVGSSDKLIQAVPKGYERQVRFYSETTLMHEEGWQNFSSGHINGPVYISIDKDILDEEYSETNWSQGKMSLPVLERLLMPFLKSGNILGIDICGECQQGMPLPQYLEAEEINGETNKELFDFLMHYSHM